MIKTMPISETESAYKPIIYGQQTPIGSGQKEPSITNVFHVAMILRHAEDGKKYLYDIMNIKKETSSLFQS